MSHAFKNIIWSLGNIKSKLDHAKDFTGLIKNFWHLFSNNIVPNLSKSPLYFMNNLFFFNSFAKNILQNTASRQLALNNENILEGLQRKKIFLGTSSIITCQTICVIYEWWRMNNALHAKHKKVFFILA